MDDHRKNIILLSIDSLRADRLHCLGYPRKITPHIDRLAEEGMLFSNAIANGPNTVYSVPSLLTSRLRISSDHPQETLAGLMRKYGYTTAAFNPNPVLFFKAAKPAVRIDRDFHLYDRMLSATKRRRIFRETVRLMIMRFLREGLQEKGQTRKAIYQFLYRLYDKTLRLAATPLTLRQHGDIPHARMINQKAVDWLKNQKSEFFLWLHYMDVHEPYVSRISENSRETMCLITKYHDFPSMLSKSEIKKLADLYDGKIMETDRALGELFQTLKDMGFYENSLIILCSDHGESFGEHGSLGHGGAYKAQLYDELLRVPLIIRGSNRRGVNDRLVQLLDVAPTICDLVHIPVPEDFRGQSVLSEEERGVVSNTKYYLSYRTNKHKLILHKDRHGQRELYDLEADPAETKDLIQQDPGTADRLQYEMLSLLESYAQGRGRRDA